MKENKQDSGHRGEAARLREAWRQARPAVRSEFFAELFRPTWDRTCGAGGADGAAPVKSGTSLDQVREFIEDMCQQDRGASERASDLYAAFLDWEAAGDEPPKSQAAFGRALVALGFCRRKSNVISWLGLRLLQRRAATSVNSTTTSHPPEIGKMRRELSH